MSQLKKLVEWKIGKSINYANDTNEWNSFDKQHWENFTSKWMRKYFSKDQNNNSEI